MGFLNKFLSNLLAPGHRSKPSVARKAPGASPARTASGSTIQPSQPQKKYDAAFMQELDQVIQKYRHDALAYYVYEAANEQGLSTVAIEKLFEQYGRYSIKPSFLPYLPNQMESDHRLVAAASDWLKQKGIESPSSNWEAAIEKYIWSSTQKEATEIVSNIKNNSASPE